MSHKRERRAALRARRRQIAAERDLAADGRRITHHALALLDRYATLPSSPAAPHPGERPRATITLYEPRRVEPDVSGLLQAAYDRGLRVLVPITLPDLDLDWALWSPTGVGEPLGRDAVADVTVAFVPGLSVDTGGTRIGQGGGCYDKSLPRVTSGAPVVCILHPEEDRTEPALAREVHDVPVDAVLTAEGIRWISCAGRG